MSFNPFSLQGKVAVITGGSTGLGKGMALGLAEAGADIVLVDHRPHEEAKSEIENLGRRCKQIVADLTNETEILQVIPTVVEQMGKVDILVNNAGTTRRSPVVEFTLQDWDAVLSLNLRTVFMLSQAAARDMLLRGYGKIINIASLLSYSGGILVPAYAASKGGVAQLTKAFTNELAGKGINCNAIAPGYMATKITEQIQNDPDRNKSILERIPAERWGSPDDLKGTVVFLASRASDYVNGQIIAVDGGWMAR
jgi:2-deoxy-D-gluconate 3-dehydrogenase